MNSDPTFKKFFEQGKRKLLADRFEEFQLRQNPSLLELTPGDFQNYYNQLKEKF